MSLGTILDIISTLSSVVIAAKAAYDLMHIKRK